MPSHDQTTAIGASASGQNRSLSSFQDESSIALSEEATSSIFLRDDLMRNREFRRYVSYVSSILSSLCAGSITSFSLYGPRFLTSLHYNQYEINTISVAAELAMYLPVPIFGYLVDRYSPRPVAFFSAIVFALGYFLAAYTYRSGPRETGGWPLGVMVLAFCAVGMGTASMYLAAVTACAKNFGNSRYKGIALALPIASFGLSGMWQSQVGSHFLSSRRADGSSEVNVFQYFLFLGCTLFAVGLIGSAAQLVVNEEELIDEAVDELERSGLVEESPFFHQDHSSMSGGRDNDYGTMIRTDFENGREPSLVRSWLSAGGENGELLKKTWLLNRETRRFLSDHTMWFLAFGFFLVTGPVETFINNCGTMLATLYPPPANVPAHAAANQVSILALASTLARLAAGFVSDLMSPSAQSAVGGQSLTSTFLQGTDRQDFRHASTEDVPQLIAADRDTPLSVDFFKDTQLEIRSHHFSVSRLTLLIITALLLTIGCGLLLSPLPIRNPNSFTAVTALLGIVNGAAFALVPLLISAVWGVQNFGTNWGIVAMMPALGATIWSAFYSIGYQTHAGEHDLCYGRQCWSGVVTGMIIAGILAMASWAWIGWGRNGWWQRGIIV